MDDEIREHILVFTTDQFDKTHKKPTPSWGTFIADQFHTFLSAVHYKSTFDNVFTPWESISGPIVKFSFDQFWERYEFKLFKPSQDYKNSICKIINSTRATHPWYGECTWGENEEFGASWLEKDLKDRDFKKRRSVWFLCSEPHMYPPVSMLMDMEAKILDNWEHYWESAKDIFESDTLPKLLQITKCFR